MNQIQGSYKSGSGETIQTFEKNGNTLLVTQSAYMILDRSGGMYIVNSIEQGLSILNWEF